MRDDSKRVVAHFMEGNKPTGLLWKKSRNRPAQVHSTSTARWKFCHPIFNQFDGLIDRRRLKRVLPSGLFFADFTKNFRRRCRSCWVYASRERHGKQNNPYTTYLHHNNDYVALSHSLTS